MRQATCYVAWNFRCSQPWTQRFIFLDLSSAEIKGVYHHTGLVSAVFKVGEILTPSKHHGFRGSNKMHVMSDFSWGGLVGQAQTDQRDDPNMEVTYRSMGDSQASPKSHDEHE